MFNTALRAWGVDKGASVRMTGRWTRSTLHHQLQHYVAAGGITSGKRLCFSVDPEQYLRYLNRTQRRVLYDESLVRHLELARRSGGSCENGIDTWYTGGDRCIVSDVIRYYGEDLNTTLVLVISSSGTPLGDRSTWARTDSESVYGSSASSWQRTSRTAPYSRCW